MHLLLSPSSSSWELTPYIQERLGCGVFVNGTWLPGKTGTTRADQLTYYNITT